MYVYVALFFLIINVLLEMDNSLEEKKEEIWVSPMTKALTSTEKSQKQRDNTKTPPKISIKFTIADRLRMISWGNDSHPTVVV